MEDFFRSLGLPVDLGSSEIGVLPQAELEALALGCSRRRSRAIGTFCPLDHQGILEVYQDANRGK